MLSFLTSTCDKISGILMLQSPLQNQAECGTSLEISICSASPSLSCFPHSLTGFSLGGLPYSITYTQTLVSGTPWRRMLAAWGNWLGHPRSYLLPQGPRTSTSMAHIWLAHSLGSSGLENQLCVNTLYGKNHGTHNSLQPQFCSLINKAK